jgi:uncharacterized membrane protein YphA (DoxX/SURF4 family)
MDNITEKMKRIAPAVARVGIALVLLWFGSQQLSDSSMWVRLIPDWAISISGMSGAALVTVNGIFEIVFGLLLLLGVFTRIAALLIALHLFSIAFVMGYTGIGVRDFGLSMAATSIFLFGADSLGLDAYWSRKKFSKALH